MFIGLGLVIGAVVLLALAGVARADAAKPAALAQDKAEQQDDAKVELKEMTGQVMTVHKRYISVEFSKTKRESLEALLPIDDKTQFERVKHLGELKRGDTVKVSYWQTYREDEEGGRIVLKTVASSIALVRSAPKDAMTSREGVGP